MSVRPATVLAALLTLACVAAAPVPAAGADRGPASDQMRAAVARAERSRLLWATVNVCNTSRHRHTIGIRGQMPALGFPAELAMDVQVDYWAGARRGLVPDPGVHHRISLGTQTRGLHQGGYTFQFSPPAILSGQITFEWRLGHRVIGRALRLTAHGVKHVDYGDPRGYSTATCRILR